MVTMLVALVAFWALFFVVGSVGRRVDGWLGSGSGGGWWRRRLVAAVSAGGLSEWPWTNLLFFVVSLLLTVSVALVA